MLVIASTLRVLGLGDFVTFMPFITLVTVWRLRGIKKMLVPLAKFADISL